MNQQNTLTKPILPVIAITLLWSLTMCRSGGNRNVPTETGPLESIETAGGPEINRIRTVYHSIPSPAEMLESMEGALMSYRGELTNSVSNLEYYNDSRSASLNLGIYMADLAYSAMFNRHEAAVDYLGTLQHLAEKIRIEEAITESLIDRARRNIQYVDTLFRISDEAFVNMVALCEDTGRPGTLVLISTGILIESLYLATHHVESHADAGQLYQHLADQKYALENLWDFALSLSDDPTVADIITDLEPLEELYGKLQMSGEGTTVSKSEEGKLVIGGSLPVLTREEFDRLKSMVTAIRNNIVTS